MHRRTLPGSQSHNEIYLVVTDHGGILVRVTRSHGKIDGYIFVTPVAGGCTVSARAVNAAVTRS